MLLCSRCYSPHPLIRLLLLLQVDSITIPLGPRLGGLVVDAEGVAKAYGDRLLYDDLSLSVPPGGL